MPLAESVRRHKAAQSDPEAT